MVELSEYFDSVLLFKFIVIVLSTLFIIAHFPWGYGWRLIGSFQRSLSTNIYSESFLGGRKLTETNNNNHSNNYPIFTTLMLFYLLLESNFKLQEKNNTSARDK